jgi:hypothetical protein
VQAAKYINDIFPDYKSGSVAPETEGNNSRCLKKTKSALCVIHSFVPQIMSFALLIEIFQYR